MSILTAEHVSVTLGKTGILHDISFTLGEHEILMLAGPNGAGKSTLLSALSHTVPYTGHIRLGDDEVSSLAPPKLARRLGLLMQKNPGSFDFTVEEVVRLGRYAARRSPFARPQDSDAQVEDALRVTGMDALRRKSLLTLSGGEVQRTFLAQVFAQDPDVLLLDEPANHLDFIYQKEIFTLISRWREEKGRGVICVVHDLTLARRFGDRALLLSGGRTSAFGAPQDVFAPETLEAVYGMDVHAWIRSLALPWLET